MNKTMHDYVVESTEGQHDGHKSECKQIFFCTLDVMLGEISSLFSERNTQLVEALCAMDADSPLFSGHEQDQAAVAINQK